jgi:predicted  nucleic acid-binding Zn-ribbon protein
MGQYLETVIGPPPQRAMAMGAYFHFLSEMRTKYKADNPNFEVTEMSKHVGELWEKISTKEKKQYEAKAEQLNAQYKADIKAYKKKAQEIRDKHAREMEQYKRKAAQLKAQFEDELRKHPRLAELKEQYDREEAKYSEAAELKAQCDSELDRLSRR